jgi:hypothetical protein
MIGRLSSFLIAATSLRTDAPRDTLELIDFEGVHTESGGSLEGIEGLENPALFLEYLLQQYKPSTAKTEKLFSFRLMSRLPQPTSKNGSSSLRMAKGCHIVAIDFR